MEVGSKLAGRHGGSLVSAADPLVAEPLAGPQHVGQARDMREAGSRRFAQSGVGRGKKCEKSRAALGRGNRFALSVVRFVLREETGRGCVAGGALHGRVWTFSFLRQNASL